MTTRAYLKGLEAARISPGSPSDGACRDLHDECKSLCNRIRDEMDKAIIPMRATHIGFAVFSFMFLLWGLLVSPIMYKGAFNLEHLLAAVVWGFVAGVPTFMLALSQKAKKEVSNYLYLRISEERSNYPDLDGLRLGGVPLSLGALSGHLVDLMRALESDIDHPARNTFRWKEGEEVELFQFNHKKNLLD